jgi:outer membrane biosynthesis protein TonB
VTFLGRGRRRIEAGSRGGTLAFTTTLVVHLAAGTAVFGTGVRDAQVMLPVYRVNLVAAPLPQPAARRAPAAVQRPAEQPAPSPRPAARTTVAPTPPPPQPAAEREPAPRTTPTEGPMPGEKPSTGSDPATVQVEGEEFQYPEYLRNIVAQVYRRWQRPSGNLVLKAEVLFLVHRDGSISNLRFVTRSGNFTFDLEAQGAIEAAASANAFGPLPEGYGNDVLPVSFFFDPQRTR